jgi:transposase
VAPRVKLDVVIADERTDGMFPLITNCHTSCREILAAYKIQPKLEKRHEQLKTVQDLSPVWLKNIDRIEALLFLYFIALLVHALLERELRQGMAKAKIPSLPLYPEERDCRAPATERILDLFQPLQRHRLFRRRTHIQTFEPQLSDLQAQVAELLNIPRSAFKTSH